MTGPLSPDEKEYAFLVATRFFDERYGATAGQGMTEAQLAKALQEGLRSSWLALRAAPNRTCFARLYKPAFPK